jgi:hypothetical protein
MFDPIPIMLATGRVRAAVEDPVPEPRPARPRLLAARALRTLADRLDQPRPMTAPAG